MPDLDHPRSADLTEDGTAHNTGPTWDRLAVGCRLDLSAGCLVLHKISEVPSGGGMLSFGYIHSVLSFQKQHLYRKLSFCLDCETPVCTAGEKTRVWFLGLPRQNTTIARTHRAMLLLWRTVIIPPPRAPTEIFRSSPPPRDVVL